MSDFEGFGEVEPYEEEDRGGEGAYAEEEEEALVEEVFKDEI